MKTLNLTQHIATKDQVEAGVIDIKKELQPKLKELLTFNKLPTEKEINARVKKLSVLILENFTGEKKDWDDISDFSMKEVLTENSISQVMIGGALWLMKPLIEELNNFTKPVFAFSTREVIEKQIDGKTIKQSIFKFQGFVPAI